jgi:hypothetical protein
VNENLVVAENIPLQYGIGEGGNAQYRKLGILRRFQIEAKNSLSTFIDSPEMINDGPKTGAR